MIGFKILATAAVVMLFLMTGHSEWPDRTAAQAAVACLVIALLQIWFN